MQKSEPQAGENKDSNSQERPCRTLLFVGVVLVAVCGLALYSRLDASAHGSRPPPLPPSPTERPESSRLILTHLVDFDLHPRPNSGVQTLDVQCRIEWLTLRQLLLALPRLQNLVVDLAPFCDAPASPRTEAGGTEVTPELETLTLKNACGGCPLLEQLLHLRSPRLKRLQIHKCNLDESACSALGGAMRAAMGSLQEIIINETRMAGCDLRGIKFRQLRKFVALEPDPSPDSATDSFVRRN